MSSAAMKPDETRLRSRTTDLDRADADRILSRNAHAGDVPHDAESDCVQSEGVDAVGRLGIYDDVSARATGPTWLRIRIGIGWLGCGWLGCGWLGGGWLRCTRRSWIGDERAVGE